MLIAGLSRARVVAGLGLMVVILAACGGGLQAMTSGQIGCAEQDIQITDKDTGWATVTWTAECHGKRFYCSSFSTGAGGAATTSQVNCKEAVAGQAQPAAAAPPGSSAPAAPGGDDQAAGCHYDTQCKGDRICVKGECVAPISAPPAAVPAASQPATTTP